MFVWPAVHPGFADSTWYFKSDNAYTFSWLVHRARSIVGSWLGAGQPVRTGAISTIYASIAPELTGSTTSRESKGLTDSICRALFGGRLLYFGPSYIFQNCFNASSRWATNPWLYNKGACQRLFEQSLDLVQQVERELGMQQQGGGESGLRPLTPGKSADAPAGHRVTPQAAAPKVNGIAAAGVAENGTALHA